MANLVFGIARFLPFGYHHVLMGFIAVVIILSCLAVAGCTSNASLIPGLFVLSLKYQDTGLVPNGPVLLRPETVQQATALVPSNASLQVNVGYFGICYTLRKPNYVCSRNIEWLASQLSPDLDPLNLLWQGQRFKNHVIWSPFFFIAIFLAFLVFLLLSTFPGWREEQDSDGSDREVKPFPSRPVSQVALICAFIADLFLLVSAIWSHVAAMAFAEGGRALAPGRVKTQLGSTSLAFNWVAFGAMTLVTVGLLVMNISIRLLDMLVEEDWTGSVVSRRSPSPPRRESKLSTRTYAHLGAPPPPPPPGASKQPYQSFQLPLMPPGSVPPPPVLPMAGPLPPVRQQRIPRWDGDE